MSIPGFHDDYGHDHHSVPINPDEDKWSRGEPTLEEVALWLNKRMGWDMYQEYDCAKKAKWTRESVKTGKPMTVTSTA
jgi:hypothetical protein